MTSPSTIHLAHSPDSDDAFMFYALADGQIDTQGLSYVHELQDIESLNQRALRGELEVTAVSIHAYAFLADRYALLSSGASMGDGYGPRLVSRSAATRADIRGARIAIDRDLRREAAVRVVRRNRTQLGGPPEAIHQARHPLLECGIADRLAARGDLD